MTEEGLKEQWGEDEIDAYKARLFAAWDDPNVREGWEGGFLSSNEYGGVCVAWFLECVMYAEHFGGPSM